MWLKREIFTKLQQHIGLEYSGPLGFAWEFIREGNGIELNNNKGREWNGMEK